MIGEVALQAPPGQIPGGATQAMSEHCREAPTQQMTRCRRNPLGERGLRCISSLLVVAVVPASPPPRSSTCPRKPHPRGPTYYSDRLLAMDKPDLDESPIFDQKVSPVGNSTEFVVL